MIEREREVRNGLFRWSAVLAPRCRYCRGSDIHLATCAWFTMPVNPRPRMEGA